MFNDLTENGILSPEANQAILPMMTALFVNGLGSNHHVDAKIGSDWLANKTNMKKQARIYRLPIDSNDYPSVASKAISKKYCRIRSEAVRGLKMPSVAADGMRTLIRGISHNFNNLLMGIWGNVTLMRLQLDASDPLYARVFELEYLVQSGAYLIHLVLGYLGERRVVAKRLRLSQLIAQMRSELPEDQTPDCELDWEPLLQWAARVQRPRIVASSTARVLELLFKRVQTHCDVMRIHASHEPEVRNKIDTIGNLVRRGLAIIEQLRMYGADAKPKMRRMGIATSLKRACALVQGRYPSIDILCRISPRLPMVHGERTGLALVFHQLISNAIEAMPHGGTLEISACTLQEKSPLTRCGVRNGSDYVVIAFQDTGCGMSAKLQKHIFEPFFTALRKHGHLGLGLAAAGGVLRMHNGYIQVLSRENAGSTFSVYLPIAGTAVEERQFKVVP